MSSEITRASGYLRITQKRVEDIEKNLTTLLSEQKERISRLDDRIKNLEHTELATLRNHVENLRQRDNLAHSAAILLNDKIEETQKSIQTIQEEISRILHLSPIRKAGKP